MARPSLTRAHRALLGLVAAGACLISGIGFAGSYSAVRELALHKGFGAFSYAFPIGVDAGIVVLLALDLVLTWLRIPFPLLRQTAWLLTVATIAFNAAASWGDPLGMGMHAVIPVLFVVVVEASRHAVGRIAAITADRHMESVRMMRWILSPVPTFRLWRRMKLWELRSYDEVVRLEQNRLVYRAQLRFRYGRGWRRAAPIQALLPLKLAKYGVPLDLTVLDQLAGPVVQEDRARAEGPEVAAVSASVAVPALAKLAAERWRDAQPTPEAQGVQGVQAVSGTQAGGAEPEVNAGQPVAQGAGQATDPAQAEVSNTARPAGQMSPWFKPPRVARPPAPQVSVRQGQVRPQAPRPEEDPVLVRPRTRAQAPDQAGVFGPRVVPAAPAATERRRTVAAGPDFGPEAYGEPGYEQEYEQDYEPQFAPDHDTAFEDGFDLEPGPAVTVDLCLDALIAIKDAGGPDPDEEGLAHYLHTTYGAVGARPDSPVPVAEVKRLWRELHASYASLGRE